MIIAHALLTSTEKLLTQAGFELAPLYKLSYGLTAANGACAHLIQF